MIRAIRLGWGLSRQHGCFIRMTDSKEMNSIIELCPIDAISKKTFDKYYRRWWDSPEILQMIPWLKGITSIKKYICVEVDVQGKILRSIK